MTQYWFVFSAGFACGAVVMIIIALAIVSRDDRDPPRIMPHV